MIYEIMLKESLRLEKEIARLQNELISYPEGDLNIVRNGKYVKWYINKQKKYHYLPKKEWKTAKILAKKKHCKLLLKNAIREKKAIDFYLRHHDKHALDKEIEFLNSNMYKNLLPSTYVPLSVKLARWMNEPYERNTSYPNHLIHDTLAGHKVRSKSEVMISSYLTKHNIPYRYECKLNLNNIFVYPDFTIRHPKTGEVFYWEHFGKLDDPEYFLNNFISKIQLYISAGILPGKQLIITTETKGQPLSEWEIERIIKQYFGD